MQRRVTRTLLQLQPIELLREREKDSIEMGMIKNRVEGDCCKHVAVHVIRHRALVSLKLDSCVFIAYRKRQDVTSAACVHDLKAARYHAAGISAGHQSLER